jgi:hypothetical protein
MYYILEADNNLRTVRHLEYESDEGLGIDFIKGSYIERLEDASAFVIEFECNKIDLPDFFEVEGATPIANQNLISAFKDAGADNFQAFPVEIHFENDIVKGYYLINVVGRVSCIDKDLTKCTKWGPSIMRVFDLKLNAESACGVNMFRDDSYQTVMFISESIKNEIESKNITGCEIRKADGWNDSHRY